jgi:TnsA-like endonuclease N terminal
MEQLEENKIEKSNCKYISETAKKEIIELYESGNYNRHKNYNIFFEKYNLGSVKIYEVIYKHITKLKTELLESCNYVINNKIFIEYSNKFLFRKDKKLIANDETYWKKHHKHIYNYIIEVTKFLDIKPKITGYYTITLSERIYCAMNNITEIQLCNTCKKIQVSYINYRVGYKKYCLNSKCYTEISGSNQNKNNNKYIQNYIVNFDNILTLQETIDTLNNQYIQILNNTKLYIINTGKYNTIKRHPEVLNSIIFYTKDLFGIKEDNIIRRIYHIVSGLDYFPKCLQCGKELKFDSVSYGYGIPNKINKTVSLFCCSKCKYVKHKRIVKKSNRIYKRKDNTKYCVICNTMYNRYTSAKTCSSKCAAILRNKHTDRVALGKKIIDAHNRGSYIESNKNKSITMKNKIKNGEFTPCVTNSWTKWDFEINNRKYRSSWDATFQLLNPKLKYEYHRIPYLDTELNKERIYITDFSDIKLKIIYEIKPKSLKDVQLNIDKFKGSRQWCKDNNYTFKIINEDYFQNKNLYFISKKYPLIYNNIKKVFNCKQTNYYGIKKWMYIFVNYVRNKLK